MKVLAVYHNHPTGSSYYRIQMPYEHLCQHYDVDFYHTNTIKDFDAEKLKEFDYVIFSREIEHFGHLPNIKHITDQIRACGAKVILDVDDYWHLSANHILLKDYKIFNQTELIKESVRYADVVHTTTGYLAEKIYPLNKNVVVLPNAVYSELYEQFTPQEIFKERYTIGWIGGACHYEDIFLLKDSLNLLHHDKNLEGKFRLVLGGYNEIHAEYKKFESIFTANKNHKEGSYGRIKATDVYNYAYGYNYLDCVLIPLNNNTFNNCKSELKLIEAGFMGKAAIVSNVTPYSDIIKDGENCLAVNKNKDFYKHIKKLINEPHYGKYLAGNLERDIKENYHISLVNKQRYQSLCTPKY